MNDGSRFDSLTDDDLEQFSGGMTCENAKVVANFYDALGSVYVAVGMPLTGTHYKERGLGVLQGGCL